MSTIERTGLYVEGIYRKSGAAPKIKELRAALEAGLYCHKNALKLVPKSYRYVLQ